MVVRRTLQPVFGLRPSHKCPAAWHAGRVKPVDALVIVICLHAIRSEEGELFPSVNVFRACLIAACCLAPIAPSNVALAASPAALPSWDRTVFRPTGAVRNTLISGKAATPVDASTSAPDFLTSLQGFEHSDRPCQSAAYFNYERALSPRVPTRVADSSKRAQRRCGYSRAGRPSTSRYAAPPSTGRRLQDGTLRVIAGVRVCMNRQRTRVKGIKAYGASIDNDGRVTRDSAYNGSFARPNCARWESPRLCPSQQVATGVQFHYTSGSNASLVGIALQCQAVTTVQLSALD